jgi:iron complex outermembrane recepter protein
MNFFKHKVIIWLFISFCWTVRAQQPCSLSFSGSVRTDAADPLTGATIQLGPYAVVAEADGKFQINNVCPGTYTLVIKFISYKDLTKTIELFSNLSQDFVLEPDVEQLEEVVIRAHQAETEHAHNTASLNTKQLAEAAGKTLGETLREIPGVNTIQAGPGIFKPVIHGVHSQRILILNYGIRQEGQQWGAEHAPEIDPFIASNVVVIKDATAIKYGTDALGGVIVVNPPELPEKSGLGGKLITVGQSNGRSGTLSGYLEGGIKNRDGWGWRVQGTTKRAGDYHTPNYSLTNTGVKELNFSAATGLHKEQYGFEIFFSHFQTELGILKGTSISSLEDLQAAMESEPPQHTTSFSYNIGEPRQAVSHNLLKINAHNKVNNGEWQVQYGYQNNKRQEFDIRRGSLRSTPSIDLILQTHTIEAEREFVKVNQIWCLGINGMAQQNTNVPGTQRIPFIPNFASFSEGAFGAAQFNLGSWAVDAGVRYDSRFYQVKGFDYKNSYFSDNLSFQNFSGTAGATWQANSMHSWNFSLSSAWRPPHVAELYSLGTHQSAAAIEYGLLLNDTTNEVMNLNEVSFRNENALKFIATHQYRGKRFQNDLSVYGNLISNYIYLKPTGITKNIRGVYPYFRYAQTDALFLGADWSLSANLSKQIKFTQNASFIYVKNLGESGNLPFIPPNRFDWSLRWSEPTRFRMKDFFFETKARFTMKQYRAPRVVTPAQLIEAKETGIDLFASDQTIFDFAAAPDGYCVLNMATGFSIKSARSTIDFRLAVDNLLDQSYREYTNRFRYYADDLGRNFILSIQLNF